MKNETKVFKIVEKITCNIQFLVINTLKRLYKYEA